tara:strand:+ start:17038 stop:18045 length:1008 start_codon:yes stop_codon:yes gene_type:complete
MSKKLSIKGNYFIITDTVTLETTRYPKDKIRAEDFGTIIHFYYTEYGTQILEYEFALLLDSEGAPFADITALFLWLDNNTGSLAKKGAVDVTLQDSTSPLIIAKFSQIVSETELSAPTTKEDRVISVVSAAGFLVGQQLNIYSVAANRLFLSIVLSIDGLNITVDNPLDYEYLIGANVSVGSINLNVDGSVTPQIFGVRNPSETSLGLSFDVVKIVFQCLTLGVNDLSKFGDIIGGLTRGLVLRKINGDYRNIFNVKTNGELKNLMYDFDIQPVSGNQQDGFTGRLTFGGQDNFGAVLRIKEGEDLQIIIQDDLSSLVRLRIIAEGSEAIDRLQN